MIYIKLAPDLCFFLCSPLQDQTIDRIGWRLWRHYPRNLFAFQFVHQKLRSNDGRRESFQAEVFINILPNGIVDAANHLLHMKNLFRNLAGHNIAVIAISDSRKGVRLLYASASQYLLVGTIALNLIAAKLRIQALKGIVTAIDNCYCVTGLVEKTRQLSANATAAKNYHSHTMPPVDIPHRRCSTRYIPLPCFIIASPERGQ